MTGVCAGQRAFHLLTTGVHELGCHCGSVWTATGSLSFVPASPQGLGTNRRTESHVLHTQTAATTRDVGRPAGDRADEVRGRVGPSALAGLHLDPVGELADLVEQRATLGEELTDLAVGVHHRGVVATAELAPDLRLRHRGELAAQVHPD